MMVFPPELSSFLKSNVWSGRGKLSPIAGDRDRLRWFPFAVRPKDAARGLAGLERYMAPHLRPVRTAVDPVSITGMRKNYSESLPKTLRNWSVNLNGLRSAAFASARQIGLVDLLNSATLRQFAESVSGFQLKLGPGLQLIRYLPGDYVGPHNDHHPEQPNLRDGYIDLQITLSNDGVARQCLLYECDGYFNKSCNVGIASGVSISMLPFWHQVTPLEAKPGRTRNARRWLLLVSFEIEGATR